MGKEEISPVILAAVDLMKKVNGGLEVEFLSGMKRTDPSETWTMEGEEIRPYIIKL